MEQQKRGIAFVRLLQMAEYLTRGGRYSLTDLALEFHVCRRTIMRDLALLNRTGLFDIRRRQCADSRGGLIRYWIPPGVPLIKRTRAARRAPSAHATPAGEV